MTTNKLITIIFLLCFSYPVISHGDSPVDTITIAWESGLKPPYLMLGKDKEPTGIAVDILTTIFKRSHITVTQKVIPWKRCLRYLELKKVEIVPNSSYKAEREAFAYFTKPLYETHLVLFYKTSKFKQPPVIRSPKDLKAFRVGGVLGFNYSQYDSVLKMDNNAHTRIALVKMLKADRVDFAVLQKEIMLARQKNGDVDLSGLDSIPDPVYPVKQFHILTVKSPEGKKLKEIIDNGIDQLSNDGTIKNIHLNYLK